MNPFTVVIEEKHHEYATRFTAPDSRQMARANTGRAGTRDPPVPHASEPYSLCPRGSAAADRCAGIALLPSRRRIVASVSARSRTLDDESRAFGNVMCLALAPGKPACCGKCFP